MTFVPSRLRAAHPRRPLKFRDFFFAVGVSTGVFIFAAGFFVPWPLGIAYLGLGLITASVVALVTR